jgi:hypothetical protein
MSFADGMFSNAIKGTLAEPAVRMVNFKARTFVISTMQLLQVSTMITFGQITCKIDPSKLPMGAAAIYSPGNKTIFGSKAQGFYADDKSMFVHECTHAIIHLMGFARALTVKNLDNEIAAYLAGAIYVVASGQTPSFANKNSPGAAAFTIASKKGIAVNQTNVGQTNAGSPIEFLDAELAPLIVAIRTTPLYADWNQDTVQRWP